MNISPNILLVLAPLFWSLNFLIGKAIAGVIPPGAMTLFRWLITIIIILPFYRKQLVLDKKVFLTHWPLILIFGLTGYFINSAGAFLAVTYTTAINAAFIAALNPIAFAVISFIFFKERISNMQVIGIIISLVGVMWILFKGDILNILSLKINIGDGFMLISVLSWAVYSTVLKKKGTIFPLNTLFPAMVLGGILVSLPYFIGEAIFTGVDWLKNLDPKHYLSILAVGIFPSFLALYSWNTALQTVSSNHAAIFLNLIPVFTTILSILILGEQFVFYHVIGGLLIFSGVVMVTNDQFFRNKLKERFATNE
ncbi:MAG: hypothetical protein JM58_03250 [Peptococcaceae bacterium BICA1-8]|nr:MAG: hypothetical protein JM58_03250 [Peptococcaceae bacterium BICA1-8]